MVKVICIAIVILYGVLLQVIELIEMGVGKEDDDEMIITTIDEVLAMCHCYSSC